MAEHEIKTILITGAAGFIGSAVTRSLVKKYPNIMIYGLDKMSYCSSLKNLNSIIRYRNFKFIKGDICQLDFMDHILVEYKIDTIMHFAAYSHVDHSFENSLIFTTNNVIGTHTLLAAAKNNNIKRFIHVSTDEVYGDSDEISTEQSILDPTNPYSASKAAAESFVRAYYYSHQLPIIITRGNNVYGPCQYPEKAIPRFSRRVQAGMKCQIQGSGQQTRSFMYISDVVAAFETILFRGKIGSTYNIGIDDEYTILDVAQRIVKLKHGDECDLSDHIETVKDRDFNDTRYNISSQKLIDLGWQPRVSLEEGLRKTYEWYLENADYWDSSELNNCLEVEKPRTIA